MSLLFNVTVVGSVIIGPQTFEERTLQVRTVPSFSIVSPPFLYLLFAFLSVKISFYELIDINIFSIYLVLVLWDRPSEDRLSRPLTCTHTFSLNLNLNLSLSLTFSLCHFLSPSLSLSHSFPLNLSLFLSQSLSHSLSLSLLLWLFLSLSFSSHQNLFYLIFKWLYNLFVLF